MKVFIGVLSLLCLAIVSRGSPIDQDEVAQDIIENNQMLDSLNTVLNYPIHIFFTRTSKFWVEARCSYLLKDFQPQLFLICS